MPERTAKLNAALEPVAGSAKKPSAPGRYSCPEYAGLVAAPMLEMQQVHGNQAVQRMLRARLIQAKLTINQPGDEYEQEADRISEHVMHTSKPWLQGNCACGGECSRCKTEQLAKQHGDLHSKAVLPNNIPENAVSPDVDEVLRSTGQPLDAKTRAFFEPRFGFDFSRVRVHADMAAGDAADRLGAQAFTIGTHIAFALGRHEPQSAEGRSLLAHELTHVVQQGGGSRDGPAAMGPPQVQRLVRTSSVTCPAAATAIANPHTGSADRSASSLLDHAITRITNAQAVRVASPAAPDVVDVGNALHTVFHLNAADAATWTLPAPDVRLPVILRRLQAAKDYIDSVVFTINCIPNGGAGFTIPGCANSACAAGTEAFSCHANPTDIVLCPDFWALGVNQRGRVWAHEVMHIMFQFINDWGQPNVHNAHCYAQFVALLNGFNSPAGFRCP